MSIDYTKHKDKRVNNPTIENRGFFAKEEQAPYDALYPRDPSLDPQLVWKGKDEQDREDLKVPTVPIYIQEKISPAAIIADLRHGPSPQPSATVAEQPMLFGDFNGLELEEGEDKFSKEVEFYEHEKNWTNRMILGDSLLVMNSLAEKEGLKGKVQCIYIDPPYGIKFGSNWQVSTRKRDVKDGKFEDAAREPEVVRAFRDTWAKGIHSYLSYLRDRLQVAHELLTETGSIFVQIGDENVHLVRCLLDEVFGAENFISLITVQKTGGLISDFVVNTLDYIVWFAKDKESAKSRRLFDPRQGGDTSLERYDLFETADGSIRPYRDDDGESEGKRLQFTSLESANPLVDFEFGTKTYKQGWKTNLAGMSTLAAANRIAVAGSKLRYKRFLDDFPVIPVTDRWESMQIGTGLTYVVQTAPSVIQRCILLATDPGDLVLDPTCGSGTTAYVAEQWGRRWITIDTSRVALQLARTRLMAAKFPYYLLSDSKEGVAQESKLTGTMPPAYDTSGDVRKGFVYKRVPHVTLKSIANNPDIKEGMTRAEIDAAISRHADTELLFDQPYEDKKRLRVTGPFTVESLSPHRVMPSDAEVPESEEAGKRDASEDFVAMTLENLRKAGVQNTKKGEKLVFDDLQPFAGRWLQARGSFTTAEGETKTVAVSVGPEYGAVSPLQVKEAAKEAVKGLGHDILVVCGYAFDPHVNEEAKAIGQLTVLPTRMNADLLMADDLLKKTGAGNLFMVFGEPDITVSSTGEGLHVELHGLDVFDPTTGEIRSASTDDTACWFIDTEYNGESFFVRHAYFTGVNEPYVKLKKALRAEIDEEAWSSLYATKSRPFPRPESGKIAIKVINHYGDEVLKVYEV